MNKYLKEYIEKNSWYKVAEIVNINKFGTVIQVEWNETEYLTKENTTVEIWDFLEFLIENGYIK